MSSTAQFGNIDCYEATRRVRAAKWASAGAASTHRPTLRQRNIANSGGSNRLQFRGHVIVSNRRFSRFFLLADGMTEGQSGDQRIMEANDIPPHVDKLLSKPPRLNELRDALAEVDQ